MRKDGDLLLWLPGEQVNDQSALSEAVKDEVYKCFPEARRAQLKTGGNFPYLSRADEVNLFLQVLPSNLIYWTSCEVVCVFLPHKLHC